MWASWRLHHIDEAVQHERHFQLSRWLIRERLEDVAGEAWLPGNAPSRVCSHGLDSTVPYAEEAAAAPSEKRWYNSDTKITDRALLL
jgi:hypothetical protein